MSINSFLATVKTRGLQNKVATWLLWVYLEELQQIEMGYHHNLKEGNLMSDYTQMQRSGNGVYYKSIL